MTKKDKPDNVIDMREALFKKELDEILQEGGIVFELDDSEAEEIIRIILEDEDDQE